MNEQETRMVQVLTDLAYAAGVIRGLGEKEVAGDLWEAISIYLVQVDRGAGVAE